MDYNLKVLFIGFNPGLRSAEIGHHYAGKSNLFWKLLFESGITPVRFAPEEDEKLLELGYGSTNIVPRPTRGISEIEPVEFKEGAAALKELLGKFRPKVACYVGMGVYKIFSSRKDAECGIQKDSSVEGVIDYVCTSPSGLNRTPYSDQLECFKGLKRLLNELD